VNSAKTTGAILKTVFLAETYPRSHIAVVRKTYKQLKATTMQSFFQLVDAGHYKFGARSDQDGYLRLNNGTEVFFIHLDAENSLTMLSGLELNTAFVDQAEEISEKAWDILETRVGRWRYAEVPDAVIARYEASHDGRPWPYRAIDGHAMPPPYLFATAYATDEIHWLYERFAEESPAWRAHWRERGYQARRTESTDNRFALQANIDVLLNKDEAFVRRFVRGLWGNPEGRIFRVDPLSILEPDPALVAKIRNITLLHRSLDHADSGRTCCLWEGTDGEDNIFVYREYTASGPDQLVSKHRQEITRLSEGETYRSSLADPSIFHRTRGIQGLMHQRRWSVADEYLDTRILTPDTVIAWAPAENAEAVTRSRLREYLHVDPNHRHPVTGELGSPRLFFLKRTDEYPQGCERVILELKAQKFIQVDEINGRPVYSDERDETVSDDCYDALKYHVVSRPPVASGPKAVGQRLRKATVAGREILLVDAWPGVVRPSDAGKPSHALEKRYSERY